MNTTSSPTGPTRPTDPTGTDDNPYDLLAQDHDEGHRWAFGTGFADPLAGIDTSVPAGLDPHALARWCLALGDDALIYSHRLQEWVTRMPELEEETAIATSRSTCSARRACCSPARRASSVRRRTRWPS